jgi:hypothetical protein
MVRVVVIVTGTTKVAILFSAADDSIYLYRHCLPWHAPSNGHVTSSAKRDYSQNNRALMIGYRGCPVYLGNSCI